MLNRIVIFFDLNQSKMSFVLMAMIFFVINFSVSFKLNNKTLYLHSDSFQEIFDEIDLLSRQSVGQKTIFTASHIIPQEMTENHLYVSFSILFYTSHLLKVIPFLLLDLPPPF